MKYLCKNIQGAKMAFVQSDEINILMTDFDKITTDAWFDGNIQKIVSVSSSLATAKFNKLRYGRVFDLGTSESSDPEIFIMDSIMDMKMAMFDSRVFIIPDPIEVENYFIWRQQDTTRNSISSVAQSLYSPKELNGKNTDEMQEMCFQRGINWNDYDIKLKRGRLILKEEYIKNEAKRTRWISADPPIFTKDREIFKQFIK